MPMKFTLQQQATLRAAVDRIIPPDDYPGAWDAGVGDYLARQFEGDLQPLLPTYCAGLDALDGEAAARFGAPFAALETEQQDAVLQHLETDDVLAAWPVAPRKFLAMLANHTAEGYYGDPGNGGNRDGLSWFMIGCETQSKGAALC